MEQTGKNDESKMEETHVDDDVDDDLLWEGIGKSFKPKRILLWVFNLIYLFDCI